MGTRAHQRIISKTKYEGCLFSNEMEYVADILNQYSCNNNIYDDTNILKDTWEIPIENLKEVIKGLKNNYKLDDVVFTDWTCQELTDKFKKENPDARYDSVVGWDTELDKRLEELSFIQPYVEDILNGLAINHTYRHKESGYDRSRTKKVRKAYSYNL